MKLTIEQLNAIPDTLIVRVKRLPGGGEGGTGKYAASVEAGQDGHTTFIDGLFATVAAMQALVRGAMANADKCGIPRAIVEKALAIDVGGTCGIGEDLAEAVEKLDIALGR